MSIRWAATALSVSPTVISVADTDRHALDFAAGEAIASAIAELTDLETSTVLAEPVEDVVLNSETNIVTITIAGLTRGKVYELAVTFMRDDTTAWTRTLAIKCVA